MQHKISLSFAGCAALAAALVLIPVPYLAAWLTAALVHELGHIGAVYLCGGRILSFRFSLGGAVLESDIESKRKSFLCCLAGPAASFLVYFLFPQIPLLSLCGLLQGLLNLIPIAELDGWRCLESLLRTVVHEETAARILSAVHILCVCMLLFLAYKGLLICLVPVGSAIIHRIRTKNGCK